jgi:broad specificity phosphatase PhoE
LKALSTRAAPGGESYPDFVARVEAEFDLLLSKSTDDKLAVVTHRGVMQCALTRFFDFSEADAWQRTEQYGAVAVVDPVKCFPDRYGDHRILSYARCDKEDV